jgi:sugar phosphate isomerase/epimerase
MPKLGLIGILGDELKIDRWGALQKVADLGYHGLEAGEFLLGPDAAANLQRLHAMGLRVLTLGTNREALRDKLDQIIANAKALQASFVTVWWIPMETRESILADADFFNQVGRRLAAEGLKLCYHNHEQEFTKVFRGVYALDLLAAHTDPAALYFELDIGWITFGGEDPARIIRRYASRTPVIHVKDLARLDERNHFTALGTGVVKIREALLAAAETGVEWAVVEQDRLRHLTALQTIAASAYYLKESALVD